VGLLVKCAHEVVKTDWAGMNCDIENNFNLLYMKEIFITFQNLIDFQARKSQFLRLPDFPGKP